MTASSAKISSVCDPRSALGAQDVHLWLGRWDTPERAADFSCRVLARYTGLEPGNMRFAWGVYGKPRLLNNPFSIEFNVSHSGDWIACAVGLNSPLGLDLEYRERGQRDILKLARRFYHEDEYRALVASQGRQRTRMFYDLWTLKEAWVKAHGGALGRDLESTVFRLADAAAFEVGPVEKVPADDSPYSCRLLQGPDDCSLALCSTYREPLVTIFRLEERGLEDGRGFELMDKARMGSGNSAGGY